MTTPAVSVEIAFDSGYLTAAASRTWTDVTSYVEAEDLARIARGRKDQFDHVSPSTLSLTLANSDGRFTPEYVSGAYYPNVKKGRPIRVRAQASLVETFADASNVSLGSASSVSGGQLTSDGTSNGYWWFTNAAWTASGDFTISYDANLVSARDIFNFAFWMTDLGSTATYDGFMFRLDTLSSSVGFYQFTNGAAGARLSGGTPAGMATGTWMTVTLSAVASTGQVTVAVVNRSTGASLYSETLTLPAGNRSGTFGQKHDGLGSGTTHIVDNIILNLPGNYSPRFLGYVDEWPVQWPGGSSTYSTVTISATSRLARTSKGAEFKSIVEEEILYDGPALYFPLSEPSGATTAGNIAPNRSDVLTVTQVGTGGTLAFGAGAGSSTDSLTAPIFTPASAGNGKLLSAALAVPVTHSSGEVLDVGFCIETTTSGQAVLRLTYGTRTDGAYEGLQVEIDSTGHVRVTGRNGPGSVTATSTAVVTDGAVHHASVRLSLAGGNLTPSVMVDGGTRVTGTAGAGEFAGVPIEYRWVTVGGVTPSLLGSGVTLDMFAGTLSHLAIFESATGLADARVTAHANAALNGFNTEASGARIARYARLAGIPVAEISTETGLSLSTAHADTTGQSPVEMMQRVAKTEDGVVFDGKDGTLTFHARSHRYGAASAFTLSCTTGEVEADFSPVLDDQHTTNDMTASRADGITVRSVNQTSINEGGYYRDTIELMTTVDNEVQARADWEVNRFGTPRVKVTSVSVDVAASSAAQQALLLAADIGTRFTITNLPAQAPASTMDFFIEGITEEIGAQTHRITFNTSAAAYANVWQLDSATFSVLDSSSVLAY